MTSVSAATGTPVSPLRAVLDSFASGCGTVPEISLRTGLPRDVVDAAVEQLVRVGRVTARELQLGCPTGGCGSCALAVEGEPSCGATAPSAPGVRGRRPALVTLTLRSAPPAK